MTGSVWTKLQKTLTAIGIATLLICFTPLSAFIVSPLIINQPIKNADAVIIFSAGFHESGSGDYCTLKRLQSGQALFRRTDARTIVCLGGVRLKDGRAYSEAMRDQLVMWGVPKAKIETVPDGGNTYLDILVMKKDLSGIELDNAIFVTSAYHTWRVRLLLNKQGIRGSVVSAEPCELDPASWPERLTVFRNAVREYLALTYSWIAGWI